MKKDPGAEKLLQRADFKAIYDASTAGAQAGKELKPASWHLRSELNTETTAVNFRTVT